MFWLGHSIFLPGLKTHHRGRPVYMYIISIKSFKCMRNTTVDLLIQSDRLTPLTKQTCT